MSETLKIILLVVGSYLFGNINIALVISKLLKGDVRKSGSGNPGTMNMIRTFGPKIGWLNLFFDVLKGAIPTLIGWLIIGKIGFADGKMGAYIGGISVITGHIFPVFLKFKGGKGIANSIGVCLVIQPYITLITFVIGVTFIFITKMGAITSFLVVSIPLAFEGFKITLQTQNALASSILLFGLFALTFFAHRKNYIKMFNGTERQVNIRKKEKPVEIDNNSAPPSISI